MKAVVLAGGKGTRLRPYTAVLPKPLVPVDDTPILEIILRQLGRAGITGVTIGEVGRAVIDLCGNGARLVRDERRVRPASSEVMRLVCDSTKLRTRAGWRPRVGLRDGLERTVRFVARHLGEYKADLYAV